MNNLTPDRLNTLLASSEAARLSAGARERLTWIAAFAANNHSVSEVCAQFNIARSTFHRWIKRFDPEDLSTLEEQTHAPVHTRTTTLDQVTADLIRRYREQSPLMGKEKISELLMQEHSMTVSASTVGRIIERDGLYFAATPLHWKKRTQYQKKNVGKETVVVQTESEAAIAINENVQAVTNNTNEEAACGCFWCSFWKSHGRGLRRTFGLASIAVNIAIVSVYLATAFWEQQSGENLSATINLHQTGTVSNLDASNFNGQ